MLQLSHLHDFRLKTLYNIPKLLRPVVSLWWST